MKIQKIVIVGNSVALRNRPHNNLTSQNYGQIIEKKLNEDKQDEIIQVKNLAFTRAMVYDLHKVYPQIINNYGDLYIINIGRTIDLKAEEHFPDGIHFSEQGNKVVSERLLDRSEEHTSELQSRPHLVCRLLLEKK